MNQGLSGLSLELMRLVNQIIEQIEIGTLRQIHYCLVAMALSFYFNDRRSYQKLSRVTTYARRKYRQLQLAGHPGFCMPDDTIRDDAIVDELREEEMPSVWQDRNAFLRILKGSYRRDFWQYQPHHVEVWGEKQTLLASLRPVTQEFGIALRACRGYTSTAMETEVGHKFERIDKPITVFFLGDWDPSGLDLERDVQARIQRASGKHFNMRRLAINKADIYDFRLPPQTIKATDSRSAKFKQSHGADTVECDALPPLVLRDRVSTAIQQLIDWPEWERQTVIQEAELNSIDEMVGRMLNLPQIGSRPDGGAL